MRAVFGKDIVKTFNKVPTIWQDDATYHDYSGTATFTAAETQQVTAILSTAGRIFQTIPAATLNDLANNKDLNQAVNTYNNAQIRAGKRITNTRQHVVGLFNYIHDKYQKEIDSRKTQRGKDAQDAKRKEILKWFANHSQQDIIKIFDLLVALADAKQMIVNKMNEAGNISTFIRTASGFRVTGVEGFVAIDHVGNAVKIVDRMEFSKANFSADVIKGWQR
jgi:tRNA G18 (ribose-2'-O)-methylase SpoU